MILFPIYLQLLFFPLFCTPFKQNLPSSCHPGCARVDTMLMQAEMTTTARTSVCVCADGCVEPVCTYLLGELTLCAQNWEAYTRRALSVRLSHPDCWQTGLRLENASRRIKWQRLFFSNWPLPLVQKKRKCRVEGGGAELTLIGACIKNSHLWINHAGLRLGCRSAGSGGNIRKKKELDRKLVVSVCLSISQSVLYLFCFPSLFN